MCSILHHWACIWMFEGHFSEYVCRWEFVCELSETLHSLYSLCRIFWEWDEWPSIRNSRSLSFPSLCYLLMWLYFMFDLSGSSLFFMFFVSPSSSFLLVIHHLCLTPWYFLTATYSRFATLFVSFLHISLSVRFASFVSSLILYSHWAPSGPWLTSFSTHIAFYTWGHEFFIIGYLGLVSLHFYHPITLAYITSYVFRPPWGHGIKCRFLQPLLGQVFEIWSMFRYRHASSSGRRLFDVWIRFNYGFGF